MNDDKTEGAQSAGSKALEVMLQILLIAVYILIRAAAATPGGVAGLVNDIKQSIKAASAPSTAANARSSGDYDIKKWYYDPPVAPRYPPPTPPNPLNPVPGNQPMDSYKPPNLAENDILSLTGGSYGTLAKPSTGGTTYPGAGINPARPAAGSIPGSQSPAGLAMPSISGNYGKR